jgi:transcriptional regulator GlxA family with amidase domain
VTGAALRMTLPHFLWQAQCFRQMEWKNCKTHWHEAVSFALNFPLLKEVSQYCFVFDVIKL